jgi:hypothetical protein
MTTSELVQDERPARTGRTQDGRFRKGHSGNPKGGRPGARHRATIAAEQILLGDIAEIAASVVNQAKAGSSWACGLVLRLLLPPARERLTPFQLPPINGPADVVDAIQSAIALAGTGEMTLTEASHVVDLLDCLRAAFETRDLQSQIEALKSEIEALRNNGAGAAKAWP